MRAAQRIVDMLLEAVPDPDRVVFFGSSRFPAAGWYASSFEEGKADLIRYGLVDANATVDQIQRSFMWLQGSGPHLRATGRRLFLNKEQLLAAMDFLGVDPDIEKVGFTDAAGKKYALTMAELLEPKWQAKAKDDAAKEAEDAAKERAKAKAEPEAEPEPLVQPAPRLRPPPEPAKARPALGPASSDEPKALPAPPLNPKPNAARLGLETRPRQDGTHRVVKITPGTPAANSELREGDVIYAILPAVDVPWDDDRTFIPEYDPHLEETIVGLLSGEPYVVFILRVRPDDSLGSFGVEITPE